MVRVAEVSIDELVNDSINDLSLSSQTLMYFIGLGIDNVADLILCCKCEDEDKYDENMILDARAGITFRYGFGLVS